MQELLRKLYLIYSKKNFRAPEKRDCGLFKLALKLFCWDWRNCISRNSCSQCRSKSTISDCVYQSPVYQTRIFLGKEG